jgi:hypothetical protein
VLSSCMEYTRVNQLRKASLVHPKRDEPLNDTDYEPSYTLAQCKDFAQAQGSTKESFT